VSDGQTLPPKQGLLKTLVRHLIHGLKHADCGIADLKILVNDWPYGIDAKIVHIVVWTKFGFEEDPSTGDLTPRARRQVDDFVTKTFRQSENPNHVGRLARFRQAAYSPTQVTWFKNWAALKSVHAIEHFHVMMYNPDPNFVKTVTCDDTSLSEQLARKKSEMKQL